MGLTTPRLLHGTGKDGSRDTKRSTPGCNQGLQPQLRQDCDLHPRHAHHSAGLAPALCASRAMRNAASTSGFLMRSANVDSWPSRAGAGAPSPAASPSSPDTALMTANVTPWTAGIGGGELAGGLEVPGAPCRHQPEAWTHCLNELPRPLLHPSPPPTFPPSMRAAGMSGQRFAFISRRRLPRWRITSRPCKGGGRLSLIAMCLQQGVRKLAGLIRSTQVLTLPQVELRLHLPPNVSTRPTCAIFLAEPQHQPQPAPACSPCRG